MHSSDDGYGRTTARYYDGAYAGLRADSADAAWYARLARQAGGPVLELGVGTGRVLLPIARELEPAGVSCVGLDRSPSMLAALAAKSPPANLRLAEAPMQDFDLGERFALVFSAFRAFQHLDTVEDQLRCLGCVRRHLLPGGAFAFDVFVPGLERTAIIEEPEAEDARFEEAGEEVVRLTSVRRELDRQLIHVRMRYERRRDGMVVGEDVVEFQMRYFFRFELEHLLARAGFTDITLYGDFEGTPFGPASSEFVIVARARESS
jgi:SAM-dependent methyltransferase